MNEPEGQTKVKLQKTHALTVFRAGQQAFSDKKDIDYNNQAIDLTIYYDLKGQEVGKGNFKVRVYCEGQLIGTDSFTLK